ncbi:MAG: hypothetical protein QW734_07300, partial [Candidatus Bathyarchaeia archaeon]
MESNSIVLNKHIFIRKAVIFLMLFLVFNVCVRSLSLPSLWFDEGWSWHLARMPIPEMMRATAADRSPFLYYLLLHFWIRIAGESEWALRWPSVAFGV